MEQITIILIVVTNIFLVLILGFLSFIAYRMFKNQNKNQESNNSTTINYHPEVLNRIKDIEKHKKKRADLFCPNHPEEPGEVSCAICDKIYCKSCIKPFKNLYFCKAHIPLIMQNEWDEVITIKTSTTEPEQGVKLYDLKKELFEKEEIPTYIETHYKIDVDHDHIETYLVMFGIKSNKEKLKFKLLDLSPDSEKDKHH